MSTPGAAAPLRFGRFELQSDERRLLVDGAPVALGGRAFDLLLALAERPGQLVGKHELMDLVWPGLVVQENNLAAQISALRKVLGDAIATIPGRGYRFVAPIERRTGRADRAATAGARPPDAPHASGSRRCAPTCPPTCPRCSGAPTTWMRSVLLVDRAPPRHRRRRGRHRQVPARAASARRRGARPIAQGVCWVELDAADRCRRIAGRRRAALGVERRPMASRWRRWSPRSRR